MFMSVVIAPVVHVSVNSCQRKNFALDAFTELNICSICCRCVELLAVGLHWPLGLLVHKSSLQFCLPDCCPVDYSYGQSFCCDTDLRMFSDIAGLHMPTLREHFILKKPPVIHHEKSPDS
ncbi:hypothetical protein ACE6H2_028430 [Prunus campanulata]